MDSNKKAAGGLWHSLAGSVGGTTASLIVQPLDVIKTRQQQLLFNPNGALAVKYRTAIGTARAIVVEEGVRALWTGTGPALYRVIPGAGLYFYFLHSLAELAKRAQPPGTPLSTTSNLMVGALARSLVAGVLMPLSVVKTRFEGLGTNPYGGTLSAVVTIAKTERLAGLFSGFWPTIMRDAPYSGFYFVFYQESKARLKHLGLPTFVLSGVSATVSGVLATVLTHPQDIIKTRLQLQVVQSAGNVAMLTPPAYYTGIGDVVRRICREEGVRGFFKGLVPRLLRRPVTAVVTWVLYEYIISGR
eukprot:TRINITY_DN27736_c0_g1_i1.p1 TRINITY_DN27736_c0_g1~~TRINITY_DN27736_c0_g1_i1.p1  ORF type:complete len:302 (-),score=80.08 TRINITY_DN27736_c0_g1_i1:565-1470(-)